MTAITDAQIKLDAFFDDEAKVAHMNSCGDSVAIELFALAAELNDAVRAGE